MVSLNRFGVCCDCGGDVTFNCEACNTWNTNIPGCATVTLNGVTIDVGGGCSDSVLCLDQFAGVRVLQATTPFANACDYIIRTPCICLDQNGGLTYDVDQKNASKLGAIATGFRLVIDVNNYTIEPNPQFSTTITPDVDTVIARGSPTDCDDFPLSWLNIPIELINIDGCGDLTAGTMDIQFSTTGCDDSVPILCNGGVSQCTNREIDTNLGLGVRGWCRDRTPGAYGKYLDGATLNIPAGWAGGGEPAVNTPLTFRRKFAGSSVIESVEAQPTTTAKIYDSSRIGAEVEYRLSAFVVRSWAAPTPLTGCPDNLSFDCNKIDGVYTGTSVNATVSGTFETAGTTA